MGSFGLSGKDLNEVKVENLKKALKRCQSFLQTIHEVVDLGNYDLDEEMEDCLTSIKSVLKDEPLSK